jgi:hypothetical protein
VTTSKKNFYLGLIQKSLPSLKLVGGFNILNLINKLQVAVMKKMTLALFVFVSSFLFSTPYDTLYYLPDTIHFASSYAIAGEIASVHTRFSDSKWLSFKVREIQFLLTTDMIGQSLNNIKFYKDTLHTVFYTQAVNKVLTADDVYPNWFKITVSEDMPDVVNYIEVSGYLSEVLNSLCAPNEISQSGHTIGFDINSEVWLVTNDLPIRLIIEGVLVSADEPKKDYHYTLADNYPNPFNPSTTIEYSLAESGRVSLKVYDVLGREVAALVNEMKAPGSYKSVFNASGLPSGMYIYQLKTKDFVSNKKMLLIK